MRGAPGHPFQLGRLAASTLLGLVACTGPAPVDAPDTDPVDTAQPADPYPGCGEVDAPPALATDRWVQAGPVPGGGVVSFVSDGTYTWAGSHSAGLWRSADEGRHWEAVLVEITHTVADLLVPVGTAELWRAGGGWLEWTPDGGETWVPTDLGKIGVSGGSGRVLALAGAGWDANRIYGLDHKGQAWASLDHGESFVLMSTLAADADWADVQHLRSLGWRLLAENEAGGGALFTDGVELWRSTDGLATWTALLAAPLVGSTLNRDPADPHHLMVAGSEGLFQSWDDGASWSAEIVGIDVSAGGFIGPGRIGLVGDGVFLAADGAGGWTSTTLLVETPTALFAEPSGRLLLAHDDGIVASDDGGATWSRSDTGMEDGGMAVLETHPSCPDRLFTASRCTGGLFASSDWGQSWTHAPGHFHYVMGIHFAPTDPDVVWAVSDDTLYLSHDGGAAWTELPARYHFHGLAVDPDGPELALVGSVGSGEWADDAGRVYRVSADGTRFDDASAGLPQNTASMHALVHWPGKPDTVLLGTYQAGDVSHRDGEGIGLYRSTDRGSSWALSSLPVASIASLEVVGDAVLAATEDGLWRTEDEGLSWTRIDGPEGWLLDVDVNAGVGLTLSVEGHAWRSDDGGDTWSALDAGLPTPDTTALAATAVSADGKVGWVTLYNRGVWTIGLD